MHWSARSSDSTMRSGRTRRRRPRCTLNARAITPRSIKQCSPIVTVSGRARSLLPPATITRCWPRACSRRAIGWEQNKLSDKRCGWTSLRSGRGSSSDIATTRKGDFLEAAGDFAACTVRGPQFAWAHFNRGLALARAGRPLEARHAYDRALELDPKFSEALVNRAMAELELNELDAARRDLLRSVELGRDDLVTLTALGETLSRTGRKTDAERYFAELLVKKPGSAVVLVARGFSRIASNPAAARSDLSQALGIESRNAHALYGMAILARGSNLREALDYLERALKVDPNLTDAVQLRALVRARLGNPAALDDIERLLQSPTSYHLYNGACALAIYSEKVHDDRQLPHAVELLTRAIASGFPAVQAAADPDLKPLRPLPEFQRVIKETAHH